MVQIQKPSWTAKFLKTISLLSLQEGTDFSGSAPVYSWSKNTIISNNVRGNLAEDTTAGLTQEPKEPNLVRLHV